MEKIILQEELLNDEELKSNGFKKNILQLEPLANKEIKIDGEKIKLIPYIAIPLQIKIIEIYLDSYFEKDENSRFIKTARRNYLGARQTLNLALIDLLTDVDLQTLNYDLFIANGFMEKIHTEVVNFYDLDFMISQIISIIEKQLEMKENIQSIKEELYTLFNEFSSNLSSENVKKELEKALIEIKNSSLSSLIDESKIESKNRKKVSKKKVEANNA